MQKKHFLSNKILITFAFRKNNNPRRIMDSIIAKQIIVKIQKDLIEKGIEVDTMTKDLTDFRNIMLEEKRPRLVKIARLIMEHIDENAGFFLGIPTEAPYVDEDSSEEEVAAEEEFTPELEELEDEAEGVESLQYLLSLIEKHEMAANYDEIGLYATAMKDF